MSILAIVFGLVIVVTAIAADRSARARHPFRAIVLNLLGIGCLVMGLVSVFSWSHHHVAPRLQVVAACQDDDQSTIVRLVLGSDGRLQYPTSSRSDDRSRRADHLDQAEAVTQAEAASDDASQPSSDDNLPITLDELDLADLEGAPDDRPDPGLAPNMRATVEIDYDARPEWVDQPDRDVGETHQISITSGPYLRKRNARKELYKQLKIVTDQYINEVVGHPHAARWIGYDGDEIRHRFVGPDRIFDEKVISASFGVMHQSHALLEFGPNFHNEVEKEWHQVMARAQLVKVALAGGAVLGMLVMLFGYFNADTATRGFYSGRLKFATAVAILVVIATGVVIAKSIPWLWL